ncbi:MULTISPECIES: LON peptidase substrate-binding domain-containing protein [Acetobacter]|uniref:ATP-dependent protease La 2 n=3 Tax=Acetobacter TaxID=434 RepID=F1YUA2_9PROT|nr:MULTISPECIES: LON peptidase substrate-binding domain-containing protein [Acetobacter]ANA12610.1 peptidase [Acetobacter oryzifermentans]ASL38996.1 peptidase [Acetobacter oryzifermentans]ATI12277.1 peptidase [Acetobacter pomorum]AXC25361.1 peptidase [Acetobacter sp. JWB]AXN01123.1 peptidase [Acetobacter pomorum]
MAAVFFQDEDDIPRRVPKLGDVTLADIPPEIGLFPLSGVVLLPRGRLPLNVFEPRYIALVEDALATQRLIGMIQPRWREEEDEANSAPPLYPIGCLGRIVSFTERADGTYAVTLAGLTRFRLLRETGETRGYRQARIDVSTFAGDLNEIPSAPFDREKLLGSMRRYFQKKGLQARWSLLEQMDDDILLVTLPMICPFPPAEKQALLDAEDLTDRVRVLQTLLDLSGPEQEGPPS